MSWMSGKAVRRRICANARKAEPKSGLPRVFLLTDPQHCPEPERLIAGLPRGWGIIYRHFGESEREQRARALVVAGRRHHICVFVSADPALAVRSRAQGVHWPESFHASALIRHWRRVGRYRLLSTAAVHGRRALGRAEVFGVDAVLLSPVFFTPSHEEARILGPCRFRLLALGADLVCYALGGTGVRAVTGWPLAGCSAMRAASGR